MLLEEFFCVFFIALHELRVKALKLMWLKNKLIDKLINNDLEVAHPQSGSSSTWFLVELEFGNVGFWGEGKTGVPGEKPLGAKERTNNKLNPHMALTPGFEPGPLWWEASALTTAPSLVPKLEHWLDLKQRYPLDLAPINSLNLCILGMMSTTASLGLILLWDVDAGLTQIDKYLYSTEDYIKVVYVKSSMFI